MILSTQRPQIRPQCRPTPPSPPSERIPSLRRDQTCRPIQLSSCLSNRRFFRPHHRRPLLTPICGHRIRSRLELYWRTSLLTSASNPVNCPHHRPLPLHHQQRRPGQAPPYSSSREDKSLCAQTVAKPTLTAAIWSGTRRFTGVQMGRRKGRKETPDATFASGTATTLLRWPFICAAMALEVVRGVIATFVAKAFRGPGCCRATCVPTPARSPSAVPSAPKRLRTRATCGPTCKPTARTNPLAVFSVARRLRSSPTCQSTRSPAASRGPKPGSRLKFNQSSVFSGEIFVNLQYSTQICYLPIRYLNLVVFITETQ